jgi:hypothetical protein
MYDLTRNEDVSDVRVWQSYFDPRPFTVTVSTLEAKTPARRILDSNDFLSEILLTNAR